ncbi:PAS domain S-box protein [Candidatus Ferrigenium straubiae]|jgi:PAS domain S-box-containing protein/putative nucleotidyltransferase with HDIG domain|uniref:PAS domain S-box protein n=1 Tax=Candidatus Ferrigenium straubiae TaxID=2919506 RepID=UPI003F4AC9C1
MSDTEKLRQELQAARQTIAELQARLGNREETHRLATLELEENRSALLFMLEDLEHARKKIEHSHKEWMDALDVVKDPIFMHDGEYRILRCNKAYQQCAGLKFGEIIGRPYYEIFPRSDGPLSCCLRAMKKATTEEEEEVAVGDTTYRSRAFPVNDEHGAYLYSVHILDDVTDSRRAEKMLRENEQNYRTLADSAPALIWASGTDHLCNYFNRPWLEFTGRTLGQELGNGWTEGVHPDDIQHCLDVYLSAFERREPFSMEYRMRRHDGEYRWMRDDGCPRYDSDGNFIGYLGYLMDVTERRLAEQELRLRAQFLDGANDSIFVSDFDGNFIYLNEAAWKSRGYTMDELMGMNLHVLDTPEYGQLLDIRFKELLEKGHCVFESAHRCKGGPVIPIEVSARLIESGGHRLILAAARDITERRQAERALRESEETYRSLFENTLNGIAHCRVIFEGETPVDIEYLRVNPGFEKITGLQEVEGRRISEVIPGYGRDNPESLEVFGRVARTREPARWEHHLAALDRWFSFSVYSPAQGEIVIVSDNITERKKAEIALNHANRALSALSAVNRSLVHADDETELLQSICRSIVEQHGYRMAWVGYVQHDENKSVKIMASAGHVEGYLDNINVTWAETERGMGPTGRAIRSGTTQLCQDFANDPRHLPWREAALQHGYVASIALPLANGEVFGALTVYADEINAFSHAEVELLEEMAGDMAFGVRTLHIRQERDLALEQNRRQVEQLQSNLEDTVHAIATIVEMRDPYTAGHQARVADLAAAIARQMGLSDEQVHGIHLAGVLHDLGKIRIPAEILSKPGKISDIERSLIEAHPQAGYDILQGINFPWPIAQMVQQHHERLDGSGYPQGLKGEAILFEARILSVADVVESMSSHRPYRPGWGVDAALEEITGQRGIHFDPQVVGACLALFHEGGYRFP